MENKIYEGVRTFDELLEREYGDMGTPGGIDTKKMLNYSLLEKC